jgi:hypothetical protein
MIEQKARKMDRVLSERNRAAHRHRPNAFHWLNKNWLIISDLYRQAVVTVIGAIIGMKKKDSKKLGGKAAHKGTALSQSKTTKTPET